jgi:glycosyltransferase 2 family protein
MYKHATGFPRFLRLFLWILIPLLLWWALKDVPFREISAVLSQLTIGQILALAGANTLLMLSLSARWWLILRAQGFPISYLMASVYRLAAFSVAYFTPGPHFGGEPWQVFLPQQRHGVPGRVALASLGLDKLLDLSANFTFLVLGVLIIFSSGLIEGEIGILILFLSLGLLAAPLTYLIWLGRGAGSEKTGGLPLTRAVNGLAARRPLPYWGEKAVRVVQESETLAASFGKRYPGAFLLAILISGLVWVGLISEFWLALHFLGASLTPAQVFSVITAARIASHPAVGLSLSLIIRARDLTFGGIGLWFAGVYSPKIKFEKLEGEQKI